MRLFVGLGNPGPKYVNNRHNVGFMAIDRIAADHGLAPFRARFQGLVSEGRLGAERVVLLKPQTFMNLSGQSVGEAMRYLKLTPADVTVFHDELDLQPFKVRLKEGGGHAGHNGLRSIHAHIGEAYQRVRIGIGHPGDKNQVAHYVLSDFAKAEEAGLDDLLGRLSAAAPALAGGNQADFMNRLAPPRPPRASAAPADGRTVKAPGSVAAAERPDGTGADDARAENTRAGSAEPAPSPLQRLLDRFR